MHQKNHATQRHQTQSHQEQNERPDRALRVPEHDDLHKNVALLLQAGSPEQALQLISKSKIKSAWVKNATGVCQLRLGNAQVAIDIYRSFLIDGGIFLRAEAPVVYKINFAVALLLNENLPGFYSVLSELRAEEHPTVQKLRAAVNTWKKKLSLWQKLKLVCGNDPNVPIQLGFSPGELE